MSDTSSWGDFTSGIGDFFSAINPLNWFGGSDSSGGSSLPSINSSSPSIDFGNASMANTFSSPSTGSSGGSPVTSTALNFGSPSSGALPTTSAFDFGSPSSPSTFSGGATTAPGGGGTDLSTKDSGNPKTDSILQSLGITPGGLLKAGIAGGGLLYNTLNSGGSSSAEKALKNQAASQSAQGQQLESYIQNGTLPPGAQQWVNQQTAAQKAAIRSQYAQMGLSGSDMEISALNNVDAQATSQMFAIANSLLQTGITETGASSDLYKALISDQNQNQQDVSSAIQNFITSIAGGGSPGKTISLNL